MNKVRLVQLVQLFWLLLFFAATASASVSHTFSIDSHITFAYSGDSQFPAPTRSQILKTLPGLAAYEAVQPAAFSQFSKHGIYLLFRAGDSFELHHQRSIGKTPTLFRRFPFRPAAMAHTPPGAAREYFLMSRDEGGNEEFQISLFDVQSKTLTPFPSPPGRASEMTFDPSGRAFVYLHSPSDSLRFDIRLGMLPSRKISGQPPPSDSRLSKSIHLKPSDTLIFRAPGIWSPLDIDSSQQNFLLLRTVNASRNEIFFLNRKLTDPSPAGYSALKQLLPNQQGLINAAFWLKAPSDENSGSMAFISDHDGRYQRLYRLNLNDSIPLALSPACECDVEWAIPSPNRKNILVALNLGGLTQLGWVNAETGAYQILSGIPEGVIAQAVFSPDGNRFGYAVTDFNTPGNAHVYNLNTLKDELWQAAPSLAKRPIPKFGLHAGLLQITPQDKLPGPQQTIPAWIIGPVKPKLSAKNPVVISIHGGPELQARPGYDPLARFLGEQYGFTVVYPNIRGSTGYGRSYQAADDLGRRVSALRDVKALLDSLDQMPDFKASPKIITGRSYGGFVSLFSALEYSKSLTAAISGVGISHFPDFLQQTKGYRRDLRRMEYGDERDSAQKVFLGSISPRNQIQTLRIPLLLLHGLNDARVPYAQSATLFDSLAKRSAPAWMLTFNEEGHGLRDRRARLVQMNLSARFILANIERQH